MNNERVLYDWMEKFDERQLGLINNCLTYVLDQPSGLPGHNLMIIISEMAQMLNSYENELKANQKL